MGGRKERATSRGLAFVYSAIVTLPPHGHHRAATVLRYRTSAAAPRTAPLIGCCWAGGGVGRGATTRAGRLVAQHLLYGWPRLRCVGRKTDHACNGRRDPPPL